jgi:hypothetical protein
MELYMKNDQGKLVPVKMNVVDTRNKLLIFELGSKSYVPSQEEVEEFGEAVRQALPRSSEVIITPHGYSKMMKNLNKEDL